MPRAGFDSVCKIGGEEGRKLGVIKIITGVIVFILLREIVASIKSDYFLF